MAAIYVSGHAGVKQNYARAIAWFEKAAMNGISNASYNLGVLYHRGLGVLYSHNFQGFEFLSLTFLLHPRSRVLG